MTHSVDISQTLFLTIPCLLNGLINKTGKMECNGLNGGPKSGPNA